MRGWLSFQPGVLFAQFSHGLLQRSYLAVQFDQQSFKIWTAQRRKGGGWRHMMQRLDGGESAQGKNEAYPHFCPSYLAANVSTIVGWRARAPMIASSYT